MHIPNPRSLEPTATIHNFYRDLNRNLIQIQEVLEIAPEVFCELLGTDTVRYEKIKKGIASHDSLKLDDFCDHIGISVENLLGGKIDFVALNKQYHRRDSTLPTAYTEDGLGLSKARSFLGMIRFARAFYGHKFEKQILRRMQIPSTIAIDPNEFVSLNLLLDVLKELRAEGFTDEDFRGTGLMTFSINRKTPLGSFLAKTNSISDLYRSVHEELLCYFDQIFDYKIQKLGQNVCRSQISMKQQFQDHFKTNTLGSREYCLFKQGVYAGMLGHKTYTFARIHEQSCMYKGDATCVYDVLW